MLALEERVDQVEDRIEDLGEFLAQLARQVATVNAATMRLEKSLERMAAGAERDRQTWDARAEKDRKEWNKRWGELSKKQGTLVEDIVAPSLRRMAEDEFACGEEELSGYRLRRRQPGDPGKRREFDFLYAGRDAVLLNETKSTVKPEYAKDFLDFLRSGDFGRYFPELAEKPVVPVFSSLYVPDDVVAYLTRHGVYVVAMGDEAMEVVNLEEVRQGPSTDCAEGLR